MRLAMGRSGRIQRRIPILLLLVVVLAVAARAKPQAGAAAGEDSPDGDYGDNYDEYNPVDYEPEYEEGELFFFFLFSASLMILGALETALPIAQQTAGSSGTSVRDSKAAANVPKFQKRQRGERLNYLGAETGGSGRRRRRRRKDVMRATSSPSPSSLFLFFFSPDPMTGSSCQRLS